MTSIAFTSLFLGLVFGTQTVGVLVEGPVAAVEYRLDGKLLGRVVEEPWSLPVDLGNELAPHELLARALDAEGREISRARQWLNLPRQRAETEIVLEREASGRAVAARLSWHSLVGSRPARVSVTFDGRPLFVDGAGRVALPPYDPQATHLLSAELESSEDVRSRTDVVLGGGARDEAKSELTAIPVRLLRGRKLPAIEDLQDDFVEAGRVLRVVAVEKGPAQVLIVRECGNQEASDALGGHRYSRPGEARGLRYDMRLSRMDRWRFLWPFAKRYADAGISSDLFESSQDYSDLDGGLHWLLTRVYYPVRLPQQRIADATAVAGLVAFGSSTRRAIVLVLGSTTDSSRLQPEAVRRYLERVHVPLFVWMLGDPRSQPDVARWGRVENIGSIDRLKRAFRLLKRDLDSQRVVWIDGKQLPQEISLTEKGVEFFEFVR